MQLKDTCPLDPLFLLEAELTARVSDMIPDKPPQENVFHGSEELKEAHVPSFDKYRELYMKSVDNPDGESPQNGSSGSKDDTCDPR